MPQLCALGCQYDSRIPRHRFPHPERNPERFEAWVCLVGGELNSAADYAFYRKKVICDIHFTDKDKNRNNRVNFLAVPTLHLHGTFSDVSRIEVQPVPEIENVSLQSTKPSLTVLADAKTFAASANEQGSNQPSSSTRMDTVLADVTHARTFAASTDEQGPNQPSSSNQMDTGHYVDKILEEPEHELVCNHPSTSSQIPSEHNYSRQLKKTTEKGKSATRRILVHSSLLEKLQLSRRRVKDLQSEIRRLNKRNANFRERLAKADKMSTSVLLEKLTKNMTAAAKIFTKMQFSQTQKKPSGRRFTIEEKVLALSMYKRSPKNYTFLAQNYTLPSAKSLKRLLTKVEVGPGLNQSIFIKMKNTVKNLSPQDRLCSLIFDEMSISPQIHYDSARDNLMGFTTTDSKKFADHALVFMVKGIKKKFKQPIAYYFTNSMKKTELKNCIKRVIRYVQSTGLNIICTVCDQSTINVSAINEIIADTKKAFTQKEKEWTHDVMEVGKAKIIPLFDVPHLLKGVRNNLLTKDLKYYDFEEEKEKTIKWEYYKNIYEADKSYGELKLLQKLTEEHVYPEKIRKMKVKSAAQVFSHSVAVAAEHLTARGDLPEECRDVIKFTKMIDDLFDSLNSSSFNVPNGKIYRGCVRKRSVHHELWKRAIKVLKTVKFVKKVKIGNKIRLTETKAIPSIKNFIRTIEGIQQLWKLLSLKYSLDAMFTRNFNQDPLENFFGNIRSYGVRNTAPNTLSFEGAYKSLLLNNFNSPHSLHGNCESDENSCLQTLDFFVTEEHSVPEILVDDEVIKFNDKKSDDEIVIPFLNLSTETKDVGQGNYVCGWVLGKCFKSVSKACKNCKIDLLGDPAATSNAYIRAREYKKDGKSLMYPNESTERCFIQIQNIVTEVLKKEVPKICIKRNIKTFTNIFVDYPFRCEIHKSNLIEYFENTIINVLVYSWCRSVNRILGGKITYCGEDETKTAAQIYKNKHKHK